MIHIKVFTFNPFYENTYIIYDETKKGVIIDPGCYEKREQEELVDFISINELSIVYLLNTHCHIDHVLGNQFVKDTYQVPLQTHELEEQVLRAVKIYAPSYGFAKYHDSHIDMHLKKGDIVSFGEIKLKVLFVPGHTPGHIAFYNEEEKICFAGDVLFKESVGRTDLPGGDFDTLVKSIQKELFTLPEEVTIYPGHGPSTTIGHEKKHNPFVEG